MCISPGYSFVIYQLKHGKFCSNAGGQGTVSIRLRDIKNSTNSVTDRYNKGVFMQPVIFN